MTAGPEVCGQCGAADVVYRNYLKQPFCQRCANPVPRPRLKVYIEPRDAWVGVYVARDAVYACLLPFVVARWWRRPK